MVDRRKWWWMKVFQWPPRTSESLIQGQIWTSCFCYMFLLHCSAPNSTVSFFSEFIRVHIMLFSLEPKHCTTSCYNGQWCHWSIAVLEKCLVSMTTRELKSLATEPLLTQSWPFFLYYLSVPLQRTETACKWSGCQCDFLLSCFLFSYPANYGSLFRSDIYCTPCSWAWSFYITNKLHQSLTTAIGECLEEKGPVLVRTRALTLTQVNHTHDQNSFGSI